MGYLVSIAELLDSSCGVTAADDGCAVCVSDSLSDCLCTNCELLELENACRAVPDNCLSALDSFRELSDRLRSDVEALPAVRDLHCRNYLAVSVCIESISNNCICRKKELNALLFSLSEDLLSEVNLVSLEEGVTDLAALSADECISHTTADDDGVSLVQKVCDNADLVGNLSTAKNSNERSCRIVERTADEVDLFLDEITASGRQEVSKTCC